MENSLLFTDEVELVGHQCPIAVLKDIKERNEENVGNYSSVQKLKANQLYELLTKVYTPYGGKVYRPNYRKDSIGVKVTECIDGGSRVALRITQSFTDLKTWCADNGIEIRPGHNQYNRTYYFS